MALKKLLHITLDMNWGGLQRLVYDLVTDSLTRPRFSMHICCLDRSGHYANELANLGVPTFIFHRRPVKIDLRLLASLFRLMRRQSYDVVHSHSGCIFYASLAAKLAGIRTVVHTEHGRYFPDKRTKILEDRFCSYFLNHYVCVSHELIRYMLETVRVKPNKLKLIINGVDTHRFHPYSPEKKRNLRFQLFGFESKMFVIGTVCRLQPIKNIEFLIKWAGEFFKDRSSIAIVVVGQGSEMDRLRQMSSSTPEGHILFTGARDDIPDLLNTFDAFVSPSKSEGTSLTILEAMASGLPVVVSDVGGNGKIVQHAMTGYLFPLNDGYCLTRAITKLMEDLHLRAALGKAARDAAVRNFDQNVMISAYYKLYEKSVAA
ncbi:MAG: glycosyltransferase [Proteobacteria bacterium]|nr:glycosyltransferase [Pseudomonadota bacterium]